MRTHSGGTRSGSLPTMTLLLLALLSLLLLTVGPVCAQPGIEQRWVSVGAGVDSPGCGSTALTPCASIAYTLDFSVPAAGATVWIDDGVYRGVDNTNLLLGAVPVRLVSLRGSSAVTLDAEGISGRRHIMINATLSAQATYASSVEGITFRGGLSILAGSVYIVGNGADSGLQWSFRDCVWEMNAVLASSPATTGTATSGGAVLLVDMARVGSTGAASLPAFVASSKALLTPPTGSPPSTPYNNDTFNNAPPLPGQMDGGVFLPAVVFTDCVFRNNSMSLPPAAALNAFIYGTSVGLDRSYARFDGCVFSNHTFGSYTVQLLGIGATWMHDTTFRDNVIGCVAANLLDLVAVTGAVSAGHAALFTECTFSNNAALAVTMPLLIGLIGANIGSVLNTFGGGQVTMIGCAVADSTGTAFSLGSQGLLRMYDSVVRDITCKNAPLVAFNAPTSALFTRSTFKHVVGTSGAIIGSVIKDALIVFRDCVLDGNIATGSGGVVDLTFAPPNVIVWFIRSELRNNVAATGGVLSLASTKARIVVRNSTFIANNALRAGGVASLAAGECWLMTSRFERNTAPSGGVLSAQTGSVFHIVNSTLRANRAYNGGALFSAQGSLGEVSRCLFDSNVAVQNGGASFDATLLAYNATTFVDNSARLGGALFLQEVSVPLVALPAEAVDTSPSAAGAGAPSLKRTCSDMFASGLVFESNVASVYGGGVHFDGDMLPCSDFCTANGPMDRQEAQNSVQSAWTTSRCSFLNNVAGANYGAHFATSLHHVRLIANRSGDALQLIDNVQESDMSSTTSVLPGLDFTMTFQLFDVLNRTYSVSGGGVDGVTLQLRVELFEPSTGAATPVTDRLLPGIALPSSGEASLTDDDIGVDAPVMLGSEFVPSTAQEGVVAFDNLQLFAPPLNAAAAAGRTSRIVVRVASDRMSLAPLAVALHVEDCPAGYVLWQISPSSSGHGLLTCVLRPAFLPGDLLRVRLQADMVLLSLFVSVIGCWTTLILVEQIISARGRGHAYISWIGLSVLAFGFSGSWCMGVISVTAVEVYNTVTGATQSFSLLPAYIFGALALLLAVPYLGLQLVFTDGDFAVKQRAYVKGLGKVNKYRQRDTTPVWQAAQKGAGASLDDDQYEQSVYETSVQKNSLLGSAGHEERELEDGPQLAHDDEDDDDQSKMPRGGRASAAPSVVRLHVEASGANTPQRFTHHQPSASMPPSITATPAFGAFSPTTPANGATQPTFFTGGRVTPTMAIEKPAQPAATVKKPVALRPSQAQQSLEEQIAAGGVSTASVTEVDASSASASAAPSPAQPGPRALTLSGEEGSITCGPLALESPTSVSVSESPMRTHHSTGSVELQPRGIPPPHASPMNQMRKIVDLSSSPSAVTRRLAPAHSSSRELASPSKGGDSPLVSSTPIHSATPPLPNPAPQQGTARETSQMHPHAARDREDSVSRSAHSSQHHASPNFHTDDDARERSTVISVHNDSHDGSKSTNDSTTVTSKEDGQAQAAAGSGLRVSFLLRKALSVRILVGLLVMCSGMVAGLMLMLGALQLDVDDAQASWSMGHAVAAAIVATFLFYPAFLLYLFLFTRARVLSVLPLVASNLVVMNLTLSGLSWRYGRGMPSPSAVLPPSLMSLIAFSISMISCILLIGINVVSLRLSRHQLSQVLKGMTVDLAKAQHQKQLLALHIQELKTWLAVAVRGRLGATDRQAHVLLHPPKAARATSDTATSKQRSDAASTAASILLDKKNAPQVSQWCDLGVVAGLQTLSNASAGSERRELETAMLALDKQDSSVFDSRPVAVQAALTRLQQLELLSEADVAGAGDLSGLPRITLEQVLAHPACVSFFLTHASRSHSEDSVLAFLSVSQYRACTDEAGRRSLASQISLDHLAPGSVYEVNVSSSMIAQLHHALRSNATLPRSLFDGMAAELMTLMQTNVWSSFVHTRAYWMCSVILLATKHTQLRKRNLQKQQAQEIADMA